MSILNQRSVDLNTGYFIYYILVFTVFMIFAYISLYSVIAFGVYWIIHYFLKVSNSKILCIHALSYGDSMKPVLPDGLKLVLLVYPFNLTVGDIVVYNSNGQLIKHRIVDIEKTSDFTVYYLKGDNDSKIEQVQRKDIQAKQLTLFSTVLYLPLSPLAFKSV